MADCIFCKIAEGKIPAKMVYEDENVIAFNDINPQMPVHVLIIPREHIPTTNDIVPSQAELVGKMVIAAAKIAKEQNLSERGYRLVFNCNSDAGQAVFHIHLHLLGGRGMSWPPG